MTTININFMKKILLALICSVALCGFTGCDDNKDGDWGPLNYTINGKKYDKPTYKVAAEGGTFTIHGKSNTGCPWLNTILYNGEYVWNVNDDPMKEQYDISGEWYNVRYVRKDVIEIIIQPNTTKDSRSVLLDLQAGDSFADITFEQAGGAVENADKAE